MYAVIETGGKQYRVKEGDQITVEKLKAADGEEIKFDQVLVIGDGKDAKIGTPYVDGAVVFGTVLSSGKGKKVIIFKYKSKKDYRKKQGHRQPFTLVEITGVAADGKKPAEKKTAAPKAERAPAAPKQEPEPKQEAAPQAEPAAPEPKPAKTPSLKSMKKAELIEFAKENKIELDEKATNAVMIETIEAALK